MLSKIKRRRFLQAAGAMALGGVPRLRGQAPPSGVMVPVTKRGYDNTGSYANLQETILTQSNIASRGIRKYFNLPLEGDARGAEAQVLILPKVPTDDGNIRDVALVASMADQLWAFDANTSDDLWMKKLAIPAKSNSSIDMYNISDHVGLLSTGYADPDSLRWYGCAWSAVDGVPQHANYSLHVLDVCNGNRVHPPLSLSDVTYQPPDGLPMQYFGKGMRKQRCSFVCTNIYGVKTIFFASGSVLETAQGASGWILAYDVASARITAALALSSKYYGAGIWQAGGSLLADDRGDLYAVTGNGGFSPPYDYAESLIKVRYAPPTGSGMGQLQVIGNWTPYTDAARVGKSPTLPTPQEMTLREKVAGVSAPTANEPVMPVNMMKEPDLTHAQIIGKRAVINPRDNKAGYSDEDLGSAPPMLVPEYGVVLVCGKDGIAYTVDANNPGNTQLSDFKNPAANYVKLKQPPFWLTYYPCDAANCTPPTPAPQDASTLDFVWDGKTRHMHSACVRYKSSIHGMMYFCWGENSQLRAWSMAPNGKSTYLACSAEVASANVQSGMPGGFMTLSANGQTPGTALLWAIIPLGDGNKTVTQGRFLCYDPENFDTFPDGSKKLRVLWDSQQWNIQFSFPKFNVPIVSGGKIFLPTYDDEILVFGLA